MASAISLDSLQREISLSGFGFAATNLLGCNLTLPSPASANVPLRPVTINPDVSLVKAGDTNTDTVLLFFGEGNGQPQGDVVKNVSSGDYSLEQTVVYNKNDWVIIYPKAAYADPTAACTANLALGRVTAVDSTGTIVTLNTAVGDAQYLYNLGQTPKLRAYSVRSGNLAVCDMYDTSTNTFARTCSTDGDWTPAASNIVALRAQYGRDTTAPLMDGIVDTFDQSTAGTACAAARSPSVRLALVARNSQVSKDDMTATAPTWSGTSGAAIDLTGTGSNWKKYRYRVFESVVPVRNLTWMGVQPGC